MSAKIDVSRKFVEFGPFSSDEILDFLERGILHSSDHVKEHGSIGWLPLIQWMASVPKKEEKPGAVTTSKVSKKSAKKPTKKKSAPSNS